MTEDRPKTSQDRAKDERGEPYWGEDWYPFDTEEEYLAYQETERRLDLKAARAVMRREAESRARATAPPPVPPPPVRPAPKWISTRAAARLLRVRNETLYYARDRALAAGVAREVGAGQVRRHVQWDEHQLQQWWKDQG